MSWSWLTLISIALFLDSLFFFAVGLYPWQGKPQQTPKIQHTQSQGFPIRLIIPKINVNTNIEYVGVTAQGAMDVPNNTTNVGWFDLGPRPGETGSAVIAGHFDGQDGQAGVFAHLDQLKEGDKVYVLYRRGITITFVVQEKRTYNPGYATDVFSRNDIAHLNLITCDGAWDGSKKSYTKRLVVFSDITSYK